MPRKRSTIWCPGVGGVHGGMASGPGTPGVKGDPGTDGREVQFQNSGTHIQWRYVGDVGWTNLVALSAITGGQGIQGIQGVQGNPGNNGSNGMNGTNGLGWSARVLKTADQTLIGTAFATVTGLDLPLLANTAYQFEFGILADADATTTGIDVAVTGPASPTQLHYTLESWTSATAKAFRGATGYDDNAANANSCGATARMYVVRGIIRNGANAGNLSPRIKRENVGTGPNVRAGSYGLLTLLS